MKHVHRAILLGATTLALSSPAVAQPSSAPTYPPTGYDMTAFDKATKPGNDFFQYSNGAYLNRSVIPTDRPTVSRRLEMTDRMETQLHELLQDVSRSVGQQPTDNRGKAGAFYTAFMDEARVEQLGASAIAPELTAIRSAASPSDLAGLMGQSAYGFYPAIVAPFIDSDLKAPESYAIYLSQSGLGLPDRDYYLKPDFAAQREAYAKYATQMLSLLGWDDPASAAGRLIAFETSIAEGSWDKAKLRDLTIQYNPKSPAELAALAPGIDWNVYLAAAKLGGRERLIVAQPDAFTRLAATYGATPLDTLKAWMAFRVADQAAPYLSKPFAEARFAFRGKVLLGQAEDRARWKRAMLAVAGGDCGADPTSCYGTFNWGVGQIYAERYFPAETKRHIEALVGDVKGAFRARLEKLDWMGPATKAEALKKLDTYTIKVGYPDKWRDYSNLVIRRDDLVGNVRRSAAADWQYYVDRSTGAVDKTDWLMTPQTNDAYNGSLRDIVFPAGILQAPMFDAKADPAYNYGAIGGVIGHELTHGFDDQGRSIDASGALRDWWTPADAAEFKRRAAILGAQYAKFEPVPGVHIKPDLTMGENIADLGGLTMALDAYHASLHGTKAPVVDGLTGDQRVFLGWAQAWAGKSKPEAIRNLTTSDPHSYRKYRVNGVVPNIDAWYAAFGIKPGDALYVPPEKRARIW
ncbi:MAG TPA: M13 family metallopeptidase [Sphingomicrobium sp.]|nr:M13 family metallopeptidase [Sphingomicrobium sp.]